jgi:hypothetical protein
MFVSSSSTIIAHETNSKGKGSSLDRVQNDFFCLSDCLAVGAETLAVTFGGAVMLSALASSATCLHPPTGRVLMIERMSRNKDSHHRLAHARWQVPEANAGHPRFSRRCPRGLSVPCDSGPREIP